MKSHKKAILFLILLVGCTLWILSSCVPWTHTNGSKPQATPSIPELVSDFSSTDVNQHANAAYWAGFYYDHPNKSILVPYLVDALQEPDCGESCSRVRAAAAQSIRQLGIYDKQAVEILISWLTESRHSEDELLQSVQTLEVFSKYASDATPGLIDVLTKQQNFSPENYQIRVAAANALSKIGDPSAVPYLISIVLSSNEPSWVRKNIAISLARYGPDTACAVPYLIPMLDSAEPELRISASLLISQATANNFPDSNQENWDPDRLGAWKFEMQPDGEYVIVTTAKDWWEKEGHLKDWPKCDKGLNGENVIP